MTIIEIIDKYKLTGSASHIDLEKALNEYAKYVWDKGCKKTIENISVTLLHPTNLTKAEKAGSDIAITIKAVGDTIKRFPIPPFEV